MERKEIPGAPPQNYVHRKANPSQAIFGTYKVYRKSIVWVQYLTYYILMSFKSKTKNLTLKQMLTY